MRVRLYLPLIIAMIEAATAVALSQEIQRLDPSVDQLVPANAVLEKVATGFNKWTEGPVWTRNGTLLFAEIPANNIDQWIPGQSATVFMHPSGYKGAEPFNGPEPGSNGMTLDPDGRVSVAGHAGRTVWRLESVDPHAQAWRCARSGEAAACDQGPAPAQRAGLFSGREILVCRGFRQETMDALSCAAGRIGYGGERISRSFFRSRERRAGRIAAGQEWKHLQLGSGRRLDYFSGGQTPRNRKVPEVVSNVAWGDADGKTLYITGSTSVYRIKLSVQGDRKH